MRLDSARALKLELALEVFAPLVASLLDRALTPRPGGPPILPPLKRLALGIARGAGPGDFHLAVRLQSRSSLIQAVLERVRARVGAELDVGFVGRVAVL